MGLLGRPKNKTEEEEIVEGIDEDDLEDEDLELLEQEKKVKAQSIRQQRPQRAQVPQVKERFVVFSQAARFGIMDKETSEILGEGDATTIQVLANILERLERIEANLGSMIGE